jgi:hypothetical protein
LTDIIVAPNQFQGFTRVNGAVTLSQPVSSRIDAVMTNANTGRPGADYQFVQDILDQVAAPVNDPLSGVTTINGTAVQGGTYGWRTAGSGDPPTTLSAGEFNASAGCTDTARHVKESFALLTFGIDRIMFSVDYPYAPNASGRAFLDRLSLAPADMAKLAHGNADALLKLKIRPAMSANSAP